MLRHAQTCPRFGGVGPEHWPNTRPCLCNVGLTADEAAALLVVS